MFMNTLRAPFYDKIIGNATTNFFDIIVIGQRIEYGIKHGRLAEATTEYGGITTTNLAFNDAKYVS